MNKEDNNGRTPAHLHQSKKEQEALLKEQPYTDGMLFADFMEQWLEAHRPELKPTTYGSYAINVTRIIVPYFRAKGILLRELTAENINDFYTDELKRVKAMTVHKYHNVINTALKYAVEKTY